MSDDNEVKGTRGFIVTTEPTKEAKDLVAQYLRDKNNELRQFQAGTSQVVPGYDSGRTQRNTLDRADYRGDLADPFNNLTLIPPGVLYRSINRRLSKKFKAVVVALSDNKDRLLISLALVVKSQPPASVANSLNAVYVVNVPGRASGLRLMVAVASMSIVAFFIMYPMAF